MSDAMTHSLPISVTPTRTRAREDFPKTRLNASLRHKERRGPVQGALQRPLATGTRPRHCRGVHVCASLDQGAKSHLAMSALDCLRAYGHTHPHPNSVGSLDRPRPRERDPTYLGRADRSTAMTSKSRKTKRSKCAPQAAKPGSPAHIVRNEGQRLLLAVPGSLAVIAAAAGVRSRRNVLDWQRGEKSPSPQSCAKLHAAFGISPHAWSFVPKVPRPKAPAVRLVDPPPMQATLPHCNKLLEAVVAAFENPSLTPRELVRLAHAEMRLLVLRHRLETAQAMLDDDTVRNHHRWQLLRAAVLRALAPFPQCTQPIAAEFARLSM